VTRRVTSAGAITHRDLLRSRVMELHPSTVLVRRASFFGRIGLVDEAIPGGYGEDYDWLLRAARVAPIRTLREPLVRVHWHSSSFFAERWRMIADAIAYLLRKHPEFATERAGLALMYGKLAFATAGAGERRQALRLALRCLTVRRGERRAWLAIAVGLRLVSARAVMRALNHLGRGL
jgi:hypothetical protein